MTSNFQIKPTNQINEDEIDLADLFSLLLKKKWKIIIITFVIMLLGSAYAFLAKPTYQLNSKLFLKTSNAEVMKITEFGAIYFPHLDPRQEMQILTSEKVLNSVIQTTHLVDILSKEMGRKISLTGAQEWLLKHINISSPKKNDALIELSIDTKDLDRDKNILHSFIAAYTQNSNQGYMQKTQSILASLGLQNKFSQQDLEQKANNNIILINPITVSDLPIKPKKALIIVLATLLGGMLGIALILVQYTFKKGVTKVDEIEATGLEVLVSIPKIFNKNQNELIAQEALRFLRTNLSYKFSHTKNASVMLSAPQIGVGKTLISQYLVTLEAKNNNKVLLIDADMRQNNLADQFQLKDLSINHLNLAYYLKNNATEFSAIKSNIENLDIIPAGKPDENPAELLNKPTFIQLLNWASNHYDRIIINSPSILNYVDACIIGAATSENILITRANKTTLEEIKEATKRFNQSGVLVNGVVFNGVEN